LINLVSNSAAELLPISNFPLNSEELLYIFIEKCKTHSLFFKTPVQPTCKIFRKLMDASEFQEILLYQDLKKLLIKNSDPDFDLIVGKFLFERSIREIDNNGFRNFELIIRMLKQSSCLNFHESSYFLSVIYSYIKKPNKTQVLKITLIFLIDFN